MKSILDKFFFRSNNLDHLNQSIKKFSKQNSVDQIIQAIKLYSTDSEIRFVGGCLRKMILNEKVDDIDLATNLTPPQVCEALKQNKITFYETGIDHGTITAVIDNNKFEITTLREDIFTDGRHAKVKFSNSWKEDASRRDFTINSIYSDVDGNLFDPFDGKSDLENGVIKFIGDADIRIKEDYLRILRYLRFFSNYSKKPHNLDVVKKIKINIGGISQLSKDRLFNELQKIIKVDTLIKISKDKLSSELLQIIFPELKNLFYFSKIEKTKIEYIKGLDFIFLLSTLIIDETDNTDYFLYKFNVSKKDQKRIKAVDNFFKDRKKIKLLTEKKLNRIFYFDGRQAVLDILNFKFFITKNPENSLIDLINQFKKKNVPIMPVKADELIKKYDIPKGKQLGEKLKKIENEWVDNNFKISEKQIYNILYN